MPVQLTILPGGLDSGKQTSPRLNTAGTELQHLRAVSGSVLQDALDMWGEIWDQLQGTVTHGVMVVPDVHNNFEPECGWPEFLEKMWQLRHYLEYAKQFCDGKK